MKKRKTERKRFQKLKKRLAKIFRFRWIRFEEPMPPPQHKEDEEVTHWMRVF